MSGNSKLTCKCGFAFAGPGEFRNCEAFICPDGQSGVTCPECGTNYVNGEEYVLNSEEKTDGKSAIEKDK